MNHDDASQPEASQADASQPEASQADASQPGTSKSGTSKSETPQRGANAEFSTLRVLRVLIPLVILAGLAASFVILDGPAWVSTLVQPRLVPAKGTIFYRGQPLAGAMVTTQPYRRGLQGALAETDEYGQFLLQTDIRGRYVAGAYAGKHKLMIAVYEPRSGPGPPRLKSPPKFVSAGSSPLVIEINPASDLNEFPFRLDDFLEADEAADDAAGQPSGMVDMILSRNDEDQDGALSMEEIEKVPQQFRERMRKADVDGSGLVDKLELRAMLEASRPEAER